MYRRKPFFISVLFIMLFAILNAASLQAALYTVKQDGTGNYTSITGAINAVSSGDTVEVQDNATYTENFEISKSLTLQSEESCTPIILCTGSPTKNNAYINIGSGTYIILRGFIIKFEGIPPVEDSSLIYNSSYNYDYKLSIQNCTLIGPGGDTSMYGIRGIYIVSNTIIEGFKYGLYYGACALPVSINGCIIENCSSAGIQLTYSNNLVSITNSTIKQTTSGTNIYIGGGKILIDGCIISDAGADNILINSGTVNLNQCIITNPAANKSNITCTHNDSYPYPANVTINHCDMVSGSDKWNVTSSDSDAAINVKNSILTGDNGILQSAGTITSDYNDIFCTNAYSGISAGANDINADPLYVQTTNPAGSDYFFYSSDSPCTTAGEFGDFIGSKGNIGQDTDVTLGIYYYPWHYTDFHGGMYLRKNLVPRQYPELGEYNDCTTDTIKQHLGWSLYAGVKVWVSSWWGEYHMGNRERTDLSLRYYILPLMASDPKYKDMRAVIHYELANYYFSNTTQTDINYIADNYFNHPNYLKIDGRPAIVVYGLGRLANYSSSKYGTMFREVVQIMRDTAAAKGYQLYIIGDVTSNTPTGNPLSDVTAGYVDAVTNYSMYGGLSSKGYGGKSQIDYYFSKQSIWKSVANGITTTYGKTVAFIPDVVPGFNDKAVRSGNYPLSRRLSGSSDEEGSFFRAALLEARKYTDPKIGNLLFITSWNEWHEDSQIEPVKVLAPPDNITSNDIAGGAYTQGFSYETYGLLYLNILREEFMVIPCDISDWRRY